MNAFVSYVHNSNDMQYNDRVSKIINQLKVYYNVITANANDESKINCFILLFSREYFKSTDCRQHVIDAIKNKNELPHYEIYLVILEDGLNLYKEREEYDLPELGRLIYSNYYKYSEENEVKKTWLINV